MEERTIVIKRGGFGTFLRGLMFGAAVGLLFAPRSGRETRAMISERGSEIRDKATEIAKDTRSRAEMYIDDARNKLNETIQGVKQGVAEGTSEAKKDLKREVEIMEDMNNPHYNL